VETICAVRKGNWAITACTCIPRGLTFQPQVRECASLLKLRCAERGAGCDVRSYGEAGEGGGGVKGGGRDNNPFASQKMYAPPPPQVSDNITVR
jgi:hypothetical protein